MSIIPGHGSNVVIFRKVRTKEILSIQSERNNGNDSKIGPEESNTHMTWWYFKNDIENSVYLKSNSSDMTK